MQFIDDHFGRLDGVIVLPRKPNGHYGHSLCGATDEDVENFVREEVVAPVAFRQHAGQQSVALVWKVRAAGHHLRHQRQ